MDNIPQNIFHPVKPKDFHKRNKKHISEDFVAENFIKLGWEVFTPFNDTGIDLIIRKEDVTRYIQVKTRSLKKNVFGFTLKSKDLVADPRHTFLLYSDATTKDRQDFIIITTLDLLKFFDKNYPKIFAPSTFRKGNGKINSLKFNHEEQKFYWGKHDFSEFTNKKGIDKMSDNTIDKNIEDKIKETAILLKKLMFQFSPGKNPEYKEITDLFEKQTEKNAISSKDQIKNLRVSQNEKFRKLSGHIQKSSNKYLEEHLVKDSD